MELVEFVKKGGGYASRRLAEKMSACVLMSVTTRTVHKGVTRSRAGMRTCVCVCARATAANVW